MRTRTVVTALLAAVAALTMTLVAVAPAQAAPTKKGQTVVTLDATAASVLDTLGVTVGTTGPAYPSGTGIAFPVVGKTGDAVIQHVGGLSLTAGGTTVTLTNYWIDLDTGLVSGIVDDTVRVDLFTLGAMTPQGVTLALTQGAADYLNAAFGLDGVFTAGLVIGYGAPAEKAANS